MGKKEGWELAALKIKTLLRLFRGVSSRVHELLFCFDTTSADLLEVLFSRVSL